MNTWNNLVKDRIGFQRMVWLVSAPRSGNTFFRICYERMFNLRSFAIYETHENCQFPYDCDGDESIFLIKTHEKPTNDWPTILLIRNPLEVMASQKVYFPEHHLEHHCQLWVDLHRGYSTKSNVKVIEFTELVNNPEQTILNAYDWQMEAKPLKVSFNELHEQAPDFFRGIPYTEVLSKEEIETVKRICDYDQCISSFK